MSTPATEAPSSFTLPDLVSHCDFPLRPNPHCQPVAAASQTWMIDGGRLSEKRLRKFKGLKAGELTAMCYPDCGAEELRVCSDFMNYLFNLDDWSDDFDSTGTRGMADCVLNTLYNPFVYDTNAIVGKMAKDFWGRMLRTAGPRCQQRFIETVDMFFQAVTQQAKERVDCVIPDLESYISVRRDTSGCKPCFVLIEYAAGIDFPDEVAEHPVIRSLNQATNDLVTWSNDIFSYNVEQARGDTHNMIPVIMRMFHLDLQTAVDFVGSLCKGSIDRFNEERKYLPSWGPEIDAQVQTYIQGLQDWIVGSLHWSFETERYFGKDGLVVKRSRHISLLPKVGQKPTLTPMTTEKTPSLFRFRGGSFVGGILTSAVDMFKLPSSLRFTRTHPTSLKNSLTPSPSHPARPLTPIVTADPPSWRAHLLASIIPLKHIISFSMSVPIPISPTLVKADRAAFRTLHGYRYRPGGNVSALLTAATSFTSYLVTTLIFLPHLFAFALTCRASLGTLLT